MILKILVALLICIVVVFVGFWLLTGGLSRGISLARGIDNPFDLFTSTTTGAAIRLPWQPEEMLPGTDVSGYADTDALDSQNPREQLNSLQDEYNQLSTQAREAKTFGTPSPYRGKVTFGSGDTQQNDPNAEYVTLRANYNNSSPVSLSGWSIQSAVSGVRMALPQAASPLIAGQLNGVTPVTLNPGAPAIVVSGPSPVGVSFRENHCTGYLAELQSFTPDLDRACPSPTDELPLSAENIQTYGETCFDYLKTTPQCHFPGNDSAGNISSACRNFAGNRLSYNGCVYAHRSDIDFASDSWHLYLASGTELWRNSHDIIRLLDEAGRTVDVLTY